MTYCVKNSQIGIVKAAFHKGYSLLLHSRYYYPAGQKKKKSILILFVATACELF